MARRVTAPSVRVGDTFGSRTVVGEPVFEATGPRGKRRWLVSLRCNCGAESVALVQNLAKSKNCKRCVAHPLRGNGVSRSALYSTWHGMKARCNQRSHSKWSRYGGRGIVVCNEWKRFQTFQNWAIAHGWSEGMEIDRIDNDGNYCPENCHFVSHRVNQHNKSTSRMETIDGETKCVAAWALDPRCSVPYQTVLSRLRYGWDIRDAVLKPAKWFRKRKIN